VPLSESKLAAALADRYRIERELGAGGMATVYLAHDVRHDRKVALKILRPELAAVIGGDRFLAEIKTTANLQHPHILSLFDSGEADGRVFYVMPYVEGESLRDRLTREHQLPVEEAVRIAREVADALEYAHHHGVIHRDIKPENILLHGGHAQVADFGIALAVSRSDGGSRMTETGMSLGTPYYMSPEQAMGEREITAKSDVYALGCVLYEMLTGEPPFTGPTAQAIIARVVTEEPRSLTLQRKTIPPHVEAAVERALSKLPADRFASAAQFAEALEKPGLVPLPTTRITAATAPAAAGRWRRRFFVAAAVAGVSLGLAAWAWVRARAASRAPASWQYISLGDSTLLTVTDPAIALSPDGSSLVFEEGHQPGRLWLKRRGQLDPTPIPGTDRAFNPVFSPDGSWIAFVADGRLKKVPTAGGVTVTLADSVGNGFGGVAWLDDGSLVYVTPTLGGLNRVSGAGGSSSVLLRDGSLPGGGGIGTPTALPGAGAVLFPYCSSACLTMSLHVLDLRTGRDKRLLEDVVQGWYLPSGRLLYVRRDGVAVVAPFDLRRLELTGAGVPVLEGVQVNLNAGFALLAWSRSGSLVYVRGIGGSPDNVLVRVSRAGAVTPIDTSWYGQFNSFAVSPDGRRMAVGVGAGAGLNIWVKQLDHGPFTRLTFGGQDRRPLWSPDGRAVAFVRDTLNTSAVYVRPADGSGQDRRLARLDRQLQEAVWSRDGRWIVARTDNGAAGAGDIVAMRLGDSTQVPVVASPFSEYHPALSPDGRWVAYTSNESGTQEVYVRPFPDAGGGRWQVSNGGGSQPLWAPDGHELFFLDGGAHLTAARVQTTPTFAVGGLTPLFDAAGFVLDAFHQSYDITPDGRSFIFARPRRQAAGLRPQLVWVDHWFTDLEARLRQ
jgi:eukaryotic-like serine/threonine-protein kinase